MTYTDVKSTTVLEDAMTVRSLVEMERISLHPTCKIILDTSLEVRQFFFSMKLSIIDSFFQSTMYGLGLYVLRSCRLG